MNLRKIDAFQERFERGLRERRDAPLTLADQERVAELTAMILKERAWFDEYIEDRFYYDEGGWPCAETMLDAMAVTLAHAIVRLTPMREGPSGSSEEPATPDAMRQVVRQALAAGLYPPQDGMKSAGQWSNVDRVDVSIIFTSDMKEAAGHMLDVICGGDIFAPEIHAEDLFRTIIERHNPEIVIKIFSPSQEEKTLRFPVQRILP